MATPAGQHQFVLFKPLPAKVFSRIARLDVHLEKNTPIPSTFGEAREELEKQARRVGADAVIKVYEQRSFTGEFLMCHVATTGIRYR